MFKKSLHKRELDVGNLEKTLLENIFHINKF
ncbi:protein of unknown function [Pseudomonas mediterranea]